MGWTERERKRKKKVAMRTEQRRARSSGSASRKWWLTIVTQDTCCARCGGILRVEREMVYRAAPREALCKLCAETDPAIRPRPSARWELSRAGVRALGIKRTNTTRGNIHA